MRRSHRQPVDLERPEAVARLAVHLHDKVGVRELLVDGNERAASEVDPRRAGLRVTWSRIGSENGREWRHNRSPDDIIPTAAGNAPHRRHRTQLRSGTLIIYNGELHRVHDVIHKTPGNLRGFVQAKMRNLRTGSMNEHRFGSTDRVEKASLDEREMEYLYSDAAGHHFMDQETFDQVTLSDD